MRVTDAAWSAEDGERSGVLDPVVHHATWSDVMGQAGAVEG
jgi:hypothetical protein